MFLSTLLIFISSPLVLSVMKHQFESGESVNIWIKYLSPLNNAQETYRYDQYFCTGNQQVEGSDDEYPGTLADALLGIEPVNLGIQIPFGGQTSNSSKEKVSTSYCTLSQLDQIAELVDKHYVIHGVIDGIDFMLEVGNTDDDSKKQVYTLMDIVIAKNGPEIIWINVRNKDPVDLVDGLQSSIDMKYRIRWIESSLGFDYRLRQRYKGLDVRSLLFSLIAIVVMISFVIWILFRSLGKDYARYESEEIGSLFTEDYGWKLLYGDVFRAPRHLSLLSAFLGCGMQGLFMILASLVWALWRKFNVTWSEFLSNLIFLYCAGSLVSGYVSAKYYMEKGGKKWLRCLFLSVILYPGLLVANSFVINSLAIAYKTTRAIGFLWIVQMVFLWVIVVLPLSLLGSLLGRNLRYFRYGDPCRTNSLPRPIPTPNDMIGASPLLLVLLAGIVPFLGISFELFYVFGSLWTAFGGYLGFEVLFGLFMISLVLSGLSGILATYYTLSRENHQWHWLTFFSSGSICIYLFFYAMYYFVALSRMSGLFQTAHYIMNTLLVLFCLYSILGSFGFICSNLFIRLIYSTVKID